MTTNARAWTILLVILALELVPFTFTFAFSPPGVAAKLYAFDAAHWPAWLAALANVVPAYAC